jgi:F0F1-type ATP synthase assembly protein I
LIVCLGPERTVRNAIPRDPVPKGSLKALQTTISRSGPAATASYTLIGAIVLLGGIGYGVDLWRGTSPWGLFAGLMLGLIVGFYELAKTIWKS